MNSCGNWEGKMSITEGIELRTKDGKEKEYISWKEGYISMWIMDYFYVIHKLDHQDIQHPVIRSTDTVFRMVIPREIIKELGEVLSNRNFEVCQDAYEYFNHDEIVKERAAKYGKYILEMYEKAVDDDIFVYYDAGN